MNSEYDFLLNLVEEASSFLSRCDLILANRSDSGVVSVSGVGGIVFGRPKMWAAWAGVGSLLKRGGGFVK